MPESTIEHQHTKTLTVVLAGNPNSGKTTVFNALTNLNQKIGNYPGVTVEKKTGRMVMPDGRIVNVLDLPGTYSLVVRSPDEKAARDVLLGRMKDTPPPDLVVCVIDANNLDRNLYLFSQIQDLGVPVIMALNMMDEVRALGKEINCELLSKRIGAPVVPLVASRKAGIEDLKKAIAGRVPAPHERLWRMGQPMEETVEQITRFLIEKKNLTRPVAFSEALVLLSYAKFDADQKCVIEHEFCEGEQLCQKVLEARKSLDKRGIRYRSEIVESRYRWIEKVLQGVVKDKGEASGGLTNRIDGILTHKVWGWLFFLGIMAFMFFMIFSIATYPMQWIDSAFLWLANLTRNGLPPGDLRDLLTDGIIAGVGGVVIFLPQILILFFFISLLQDTGYMARAAFIMDRVMSCFGLHGKSFIPLLSSFACAIPGIMAARTIESPKDRLVTVLVAPLMSCSARLPVYTILIAVLMPRSSALEKAGLMLMLYLLGIVGVGVMAWIFKKTLFRGEKPLFIMELPPYRMPSLKTVALHMQDRSRQFLKRAGTVILAMSILLWGLMTYPKFDHPDAGERLRHSFAGRIGTTIEPALKPLGYDWRIGIGLVGAFAAREVFVSTMSIVFNITEEDQEVTLLQAFKKASWPDGRPLFTPLACLSLLVFFVYAMQCLSTIALVWKETGRAGWAMFQLAYMTGMAYLVALLVYQGGRLMGW
ncbi:MAG: ferrous iron transport protein B [Candidatus Omnitrophota bacterium]|nr:ferrous iron transport protein B [Candidatus Omnitrophota bacterium]